MTSSGDRIKALERNAALYRQMAHQLESGTGLSLSGLMADHEAWNATTVAGLIRWADELTAAANKLRKETGNQLDYPC